MASFLDTWFNNHTFENGAIERISFTLFHTLNGGRSLVAIQQCKFAKTYSARKEFDNLNFLFDIWVLRICSFDIDSNFDLALGKYIVFETYVAIIDDYVSGLVMLFLHDPCKLADFFFCQIFGKKVVFKQWNNLVQLLQWLNILRHFVKINNAQIHFLKDRRSLFLFVNPVRNLLHKALWPVWLHYRVCHCHRVWVAISLESPENSWVYIFNFFANHILVSF